MRRHGFEPNQREKMITKHENGFSITPKNRLSSVSSVGDVTNSENENGISSLSSVGGVGVSENKSGVSSVLSVPPMGISENKSGVSSLSSVGGGGVFEKLREIKVNLPAAPEFDADELLPSYLADFVLDEADRMPCPPDYVAAALIVSLGSVLGGKVGLRPKRNDDWVVTPNLWGGVVGSPSSKKTPSISPSLKNLDRLEANETKRVEEEMRIYESELAAHEALESAIKATMKAAARTDSGGTSKMDAARYDLQTLEKPTEPVARRFKSNDATTAKIGDILSKQQFGIMVFRDELMGLLSSWDQEGREGDKTFFLEGWNGIHSFSVDRIGRGEKRIDRLCLSIFGGIQPDILERYLANMNRSMDNDGRVQRFQVLVYPNSVEWQWRDRRPAQGVREKVRDVFDRLAHFDPIQDGFMPADEFVSIPSVRFTEEAQELYIQWSTDLHTRVIPEEDDQLLQQHFAKYEKLFASLSLIFHMADGGMGDVGIDSAARAATWCDYLAGHARRIYGLVASAATNGAILISKKIQKCGLRDGFTIRDVVRKNWTGLKTTQEVNNAVEILLEYGWLFRIEQDPFTTVGRPTERFLINPLVKVGGCDDE
jgi:Protein of unknown function (DUF3987)